MKNKKRSGWKLYFHTVNLFSLDPVIVGRLTCLTFINYLKNVAIIKFFSDLETIVLGYFNSNALKLQSNMLSAVKHLMFIFN